MTFAPASAALSGNTQYAKALDDLVKAGDALTDTLTEKQNELFEDYMTAQREVNVLTDCETFTPAQTRLFRENTAADISRNLIRHGEAVDRDALFHDSA